jgi:uncharacterized protein YyaL (SSP411 family)
MAHESFEDAGVATLMNDRFVNIKVDREERPDVDAIYMDAVQAMTGSGGWPLNVFLTPEGKPFFGGTYFPPAPRHGLPAWQQVVEAIAEAYRTQRDDIEHNATILTESVSRGQKLAGAEGPPVAEVLHTSEESILASEDRRFGGFGGAPKFPAPLALEFLLRRYSRTGRTDILAAVTRTLDAMAHGGIHDHLGGGFHRYTVDGAWVVPHFEKMLYDNAMLARVYLHAYLVTGNPEYRLVTEDTLTYLLREMQSEEGGFYASQDADSEGVEGKFYVWTPDEIAAVLSGDALTLARMYFDITAGGNFEGSTILTTLRPVDQVATTLTWPPERAANALSEARRQLLEARSHRVPPGTDRKIVTAWNGLAIAALAEAGRSLGVPEFSRAAERAAGFLLGAMRPDGQLVRTYLDTPGATPAFLDDYADLIDALLTLSERVPNMAYLDAATALAHEMIDRFWSEDDGLFFDASLDRGLVVRPRSLYDSPTPSGNAAAALSLQRLAALTEGEVFDDVASRVLATARGTIERAPLAFPHLLSALDLAAEPVVQVALAVPGDADAAADPFLDALFRDYRPTTVAVTGTAGSAALLTDRTAIGGQVTAYVCEHFACRLPVTTVEEMVAQIDGATRSSAS